MTGNARQHLQRAAALFQAKDFDGVLAICREIEAFAPEDPEIDHMKGLALGRLGRIDEAAPSFERAAARHPQKHAVLSNLGNALRANGRNDAAIGAYRRSVAAAPDFFQGWCNLGVALRDAGLSDASGEASRRALEIRPGDPGVLNNLGVLMSGADRWEEAIEYFDAALGGAPQLVSALVNRGAALRNAGRIDDAIRDLEKAVGLAPHMGETHYQYANAMRQAGERAAADAAYLRALERDPFRKEVHEDYAKMLWEFGERGRFLSAIDRANARQPTHDLYVLRGTLCARAGDQAGAYRAAEAALALNPDSVEAFRVKSLALRASGEIEPAIVAARAATDADAGHFGALHDLAELLLVEKRFDEAAELLSGDCPDAHAQQHIGLRVLAMRGRGDEAYRDYYDYDRFTARRMIAPPPGFESVAAFNAALVEALAPLHPTQTQPIDQTLFGGTQSLGALWREPNPVIQALRSALLEEAKKFIATLPDDPAHPFLRQKTSDIVSAGSWSVMLSAGGGHVDHIHPKGWLSGVYYVRVPDEVENGDREGFLRLGGSGVIGLDLPPDRWVQPVEGAVVFFPSYMWHGVEPFDSTAQRVTAPFDLAPASRSS